MKIQISRKTEIERKLYLSVGYRGQRTRRKLGMWRKASSPLSLDLEEEERRKGDGKAVLGTYPERASEDT